jgi:hypothetical protein
MFHEKAKNKLYNSAMITYLLCKVRVEDGEIKELINPNLQTDYGRIKNLLGKTNNIEKLEQLIEFGKIESEVKTRFSIDKIHISENFLSLLYYMGLLTIDKDPETNSSLLRIPNYSVRTMYWEYIRDILININPELSHNEIKYWKSLQGFAIYGKAEEFIKFIQEYYVGRFSNRDYINFDEKYIKAIILTLIFQGHYHLPISEYEVSGGYVDIYLQHRTLNPLVKLDWVWELKYVKEGECDNEKLIEEKKTEARTQLQRYKSSDKFEGRDNVRFLAIVFVGKRNYFVEEV